MTIEEQRKQLLTTLREAEIHYGAARQDCEWDAAQTEAMKIMNLCRQLTLLEILLLKKITPPKMKRAAGCGSSIFQQNMNKKFVTESNLIEGITRPPTKAELDEFERFLALPKITAAELQNFVAVYQPDAVLRDRVGLNVRVGNHIPPRGCPEIRERLAELLERVNLMPESAHKHHLEYEMLHPFTDGNGRSGRAVWAWQMRRFPLGFLHHFYYQTLGTTNRESHNEPSSATR